MIPKAFSLITLVVVLYATLKIAYGLPVPENEMAKPQTEILDPLNFDKNRHHQQKEQISSSSNIKHQQINVKYNSNMQLPGIFYKESDIYRPGRVSGTFSGSYWPTGNEIAINWSKHADCSFECYKKNSGVMFLYDCMMGCTAHLVSGVPFEEKKFSQF